MFLQMLWTFLLVLAVVAALAVGFLYRLFDRTPQKRWRDRVLRLWNLARRQAQAERSEREGLGTWREERERALRDQAFAGVPAGISIGQLEAYPGIPASDRAPSASCAWPAIPHAQ